jgi:hypothetical protein
MLSVANKSIILNVVAPGTALFVNDRLTRKIVSRLNTLDMFVLLSVTKKINHSYIPLPVLLAQG